MPNRFSAAARVFMGSRRRVSSARKDSVNGAGRPVVIPESLEARTFLSVSQDANGFTVITPEAGDRVVYVSNSAGSDDNSGFSPDSPVKSLGKATSLIRNDTGDQMLLKRGDTWTNETFNGWSRSGKSEQQPIVIGAYGAGDRPLLNTGSKSAFYAGSGGDSPVDHVSLIGLQFVAHTRIPGDNFVSTDGNAGIRLLAPTDDFRVEDCVIRGYRDNILLQDFFGPLTNITVRRSIIIDAYGKNSHAQGLYAQGVDGLVLEENIFDHNGWYAGVAGAHQTGFNHNVYMRSDNTGVVVRGNVFARASSHGLQARSGGIVENNLFVDNPIGMTFGMVNGSPAMAGGVEGYVKGNVFAGGDNASIGNSVRGYGLDIGNTKPGANVTVSNNLFAGSGDGESPAITLSVGSDVDNFADTAGINDLTFSDNIIHRWAMGMRINGNLDTGVVGPKGLNNLVMRDNDFQEITGRTLAHDAKFDSAAETWSGNRYDDSIEMTVQFSLKKWDAWRSDSEPTAKQTKVKYDAPERTTQTYNQALGGEATEEAFLATLRGNGSGQNWDPRLTAASINAYMRAGFAESGVPVWAGEPTGPGTGGSNTPTPTNPGGPTDETPTPPVNPGPSGPVTPVPVTVSSLPNKVQVTEGASVMTFAVTYVTEQAGAVINLASLDADALRVVSRKGAFDAAASLISVEQTSEDTAVATYSVASPEGGWTRTNKGTYAIVPETLASAEGATLEDGARTADKPLGQFKLAVTKAPPPPPPDKAPFVKKLKFSPRGESAVSVTFSEDVSLSVDAGDLFLIAEDGSRVIDPAVTAVTYDPAKHIATWTFPGLADGTLPKGKYRVSIAGWGIADSLNQTLDGDRDGTPGDDYAPTKWFKV